MKEVIYKHFLLPRRTFSKHDVYPLSTTNVKRFIFTDVGVINKYARHNIKVYIHFFALASFSTQNSDINSTNVISFTITVSQVAQNLTI